jgi:uncharacterized protein YndB with AHSA1/START domain
MYDLKIEKIIAKEASEVFRSLKAGRLFMNCSADSNSIEIDFREGGKYKLNFKNHKVSNWGEFLEIIPDKKIVFSWCQTFGADQRPDTKVTIELFPENSKTRLVLEHSGFNDKSTCDNHYQGWNGGINDLSSEMEQGQINLVRRYETSVEKLFDLVKGSKQLFGEFSDIVPNEKITLKSNATLLFLKREGDTSALQIIQAGLQSESAKDLSRNNWDKITTNLVEMLGSP